MSPGFGQANLAIAGSAQAALANAFIGNRAISGALRFDLALNGPFALSSLSGPVRFDLRLKGPLRLASLSGRVSLAGGRLSDPDNRFSFQRLEAVLDLAAGKARVAATAQVATGGRIRVDGPVALAAPYAADLAISLDGVKLIDPELYQTTASGTLQVTGPLTAGALISGRIGLADTEIRVPSTGFGGTGGLPTSTRHRHRMASRWRRSIWIAMPTPI